MMLARIVGNRSSAKSKPAKRFAWRGSTRASRMLADHDQGAMTTGHGSRLRPATESPNAMPPSPIPATTSP